MQCHSCCFLPGWKENWIKNSRYWLDYCCNWSQRLSLLPKKNLITIFAQLIKRLSFAWSTLSSQQENLSLEVIGRIDVMSSYARDMKFPNELKNGDLSQEMFVLCRYVWMYCMNVVLLMPTAKFGSDLPGSKSCLFTKQVFVIYAYLYINFILFYWHTLQIRHSNLK